MNKNKVSIDELFELIKLNIESNKKDVINTLNKSYINVNSDVSDKELFLIIERQLKEGNGYIAFHLESLINKNTPSLNIKNKEYSNIAPIIMAGVSVLGSLFGGKKGDDGQAQAQAQAQNQQMMMQYQMAQQSQENARRREDARREEEKQARRTTNMMIFGGIGLVLVLGVGIWAITRKK
jgi:hypothetical protein